MTFVSSLLLEQKLSKYYVIIKDIWKNKFFNLKIFRHIFPQTVDFSHLIMITVISILTRCELVYAQISISCETREDLNKY